MKLENVLRCKHVFMKEIGTPPRPSEISEKNWEHNGEAIFDIPFMIQIHVESIKKILGAL